MSRILPSIIIISLLLIPIVSANPFTDLWNWLTGSSEENIDILNSNERINILDSNIVETCNGNDCFSDIYRDGKFQYYNNQFYFFNETHSITNEDNLDSRYEYIDNIEINYRPVVEINGKVQDLNSLPTISDTPLNYITQFQKERDLTKFKISFDKINKLDKIGFQITSNQPINYIDYEYLPSGFYTDENPPIYYNLTDLQIGNKRISYIQEIENGIDVTFDKRNNIMWFDISDKPIGRISIDPWESIFSNSTDGFFVVNEPNTCISATDGLTTGSIGDSHVASPATMFEGVMEFNLSGIGGGVTIDNIRLRLYRNAFVLSGRPPPVVTWNVDYGKRNYSIGATLTCGDRGVSDAGQGTEDWLETTGIIWHTFTQPTKVNLTGTIVVKLTAGTGWLHVAAAKEAIATFRTSEFAGTTSDPMIQVNYTLGVCTNNYVSGDFIIDDGEEVNCTSEQFNINGATQVNGNALLNLFDNTNITLNQTDYNYVNSSGGRIMFYNFSKII